MIINFTVLNENGMINTLKCNICDKIFTHDYSSDKFAFESHQCLGMYRDAPIKLRKNKSRPEIADYILAKNCPDCQYHLECKKENEKYYDIVCTSRCLAISNMKNNIKETFY